MGSEIRVEMVAYRLAADLIRRLKLEVCIFRAMI